MGKQPRDKLGRFTSKKRNALTVAKAKKGSKITAMSKPSKPKVKPLIDIPEIRQLAILVLDRSGSMDGVRDATVKGVNNYMLEQVAAEPNGYFSLLQFGSNERIYTYNVTPNTAVKPLTRSDYRPRGGTPLKDAVADAIRDASSKISSMSRDVAPRVVTVTVLTDGQGTGSQISETELQKLVKEKENSGWRFYYLGANHNAVKQAASLGISGSGVMNFDATPGGVAKAFKTITKLNVGV